MSASKTRPQTRYGAITPDEEWVMALQAVPGHRRAYFMRFVRREIILIDAVIKLDAGESVRGRFRAAREGFAKNRATIERAFHRTARGLGVPIPSYERRGVTPFNCNRDEFERLVAEWAVRVPLALRANGYRAFTRWTEATEAIQIQ